MTCSHRSCVPKARTPSTCVTVLASQPSVSMETETTQRMEPPSRPCLPTVFMTSRSRSWSVMFSPARGIAGALDDLAAEALDLVGRHAAEVVVQRFAGFELLAVDQQRVRAGKRIAVLVEVAEQRQAAVFERCRAVFVLAVEAGDVVVDQLGGGRVVADDDEARRHADACLFPQLVGLLVVAVESFERRLQLRRQARAGRASFALPRPFFGILDADVFPKVAEHRHLVAGDVVGHGHARQLDDAALDGVHEREVAHRPRKQRALGIAGAAQEERRGGQDR